MNLDELVAWGAATLCYLDDPRPLGGRPVDRAALANKLGWLLEYRIALDQWKALLRVATTTQTYIRQAGYHHQAVDELGPDPKARHGHLRGRASS